MVYYPYSLQPGRIGTLEVANRLICPAMVTQYCTEDGLPTERFIRYHERKARGGWGLVMTEDYAVMEEARSFRRLPGLWDDRQVPAHKEFVRRVHRAGGKIGVQLFHPGRETTSEVAGTAPVAPSPVCEPSMPEAPAELDCAGIREIVEAFGRAALRAKECGFDLIEVHGAHGYLINEFLSPYANKRTDAYGGCLRGRARFALEVIGAVRSAVGPDMPLSFRINVNDHVQGGITPQMAAAYARLLEAAGVDLIDCSQGMYVSKEFTIPPTAVSPAAFVADARPVKQAVGIPVAVVGRINDPDIAEELLASGQADFAAMGRASLADPDLPLKMASGHAERVIRCVGCCRGCTGQNARKEPICCVLNPETGREGAYDLSPAPFPKKVLVAGGGISGCEAAIAAARRGHRVTLYESSGRLGGQWLLAAVPPGKEELSSFAHWQAGELARQGVEVRLSTPVDATVVQSEGPDAVIVATGSEGAAPAIPGLAGNPHVHDARDVLAGKVALSGKVAVLGGGLVGAETALYLAEQRCDVTVVEMLDGIALDTEYSPRKLLLEGLRARGASLMTACKVMKVDAGTVEVRREGAAVRLNCPNGIVSALGIKPVRPDAQVFAGYKGKVLFVGDCAGGGSAFDDVRQGFEVGLSV